MRKGQGGHFDDTTRKTGSRPQAAGALPLPERKLRLLCAGRIWERDSFAGTGEKKRRLLHGSQQPPLFLAITVYPCALCVNG